MFECKHPFVHEHRCLEKSDCLIITIVFHASVPLNCTGFYCEVVWGRQPPRVNQPNEKPRTSEEMITSGRKALDWLRDCVGTGRIKHHLAFHSVSLASARMDVCVLPPQLYKTHASYCDCPQASWWSLKSNIYHLQSRFLNFCNIERT